MCLWRLQGCCVRRLQAKLASTLALTARYDDVQGSIKISASVCKTLAKRSRAIPQGRLRAALANNSNSTLPSTPRPRPDVDGREAQPRLAARAPPPRAAPRAGRPQATPRAARRSSRPGRAARSTAAVQREAVEAALLPPPPVHLRVSVGAVADDRHRERLRVASYLVRAARMRRRDDQRTPRVLLARNLPKRRLRGPELSIVALDGLLDDNLAAHGVALVEAAQQSHVLLDAVAQPAVALARRLAVEAEQDGSRSSGGRGGGPCRPSCGTGAAAASSRLFVCRCRTICASRCQAAY